jgi:hypothetical protein
MKEKPPSAIMMVKVSAYRKYLSKDVKSKQKIAKGQ